jgi:hypothetical protein
MQPIFRVLIFILLCSAALAQNSRPFRMATTAIQANPEANFGYDSYLTEDSLAATVAETDVLSIFPEYLGIPYAEFANSARPPAAHAWTVKMQLLATKMRSLGKPLMLQLVLTRSTKTKTAVDVDGGLVLDQSSNTLCFDFAAPQHQWVGTAYVNYVRWMTATFQPMYLVVAIEANLYYVHCGGDTPSWQRLVQIERNAYDAAKAERLFTVVFPSFKLEDLYNHTLAGFDEAQYAAMANLKRDRFGIASYPYSNRRPAGEFINPFELPLDYLVRVKNRHPNEKRLVITETGWNAASIAVNLGDGCLQDYLYSQEFFSYAYLNLVLYSGYLGNFDVITWWSDRDLIEEPVMNACTPRATAPGYPECNGNPWCIEINQLQDSSQGLWTTAFAEIVFKAFGAMGLRSYDGTPRLEHIELWNRIRVMPRN